MGGKNDSIQSGLHAGAMVGAAIGKLAGKKTGSKIESKAPMTKEMVDMVLDKIREKDIEGAMTLLNAWSNKYQVDIAKFFPKKQGSPEVGYKPIGNAKVFKKAKTSHSRSNIDILTDTTISDSQRRAELKKANNWTDAQVDAFIKKQVTGKPAKGHLEIGDAYETMGMSRQRAYDNVASVSEQEASEYSKRIFGADFTK